MVNVPLGWKAIRRARKVWIRLIFFPALCSRSNSVLAAAHFRTTWIPSFSPRLLPDEMYEKITVREIRQGSWAVFVGTTMVDAFHGEGALQKANEKAERLADART